MNVKETKDKLNAVLLKTREIAAKAEGEKREFTADEKSEVEALIKEAGELKGQIAARESDEALRKQIADLGAGLALMQGGGQPTEGAPASGKGTIGEQFVATIAPWLKQVAPGGLIPDGTRGLTSPALQLRGIPGRKDLITGADETSAGAFVQTDYTGIYEPLGRYPLTIRDLISVRQTGSDLVEFVRQTQQVTEAAPTPEANVKDYTGATGEISGTKPQGAIYWEKVTATVKTIAVWVAATRRALADASQLRGIIDQELRDDIAEELEDQILNGDGLGENFTGVLNTAGILTQAFNADILTTCRQAITTIQVTGHARPTAWVFHPADWETVDLLQDGVNQFYWGGPLQQGPPRLWGVPVVQSQAKAQGSAILADWRKAVLWDRQATQIFVTDSHSDFFIRNIIAILAEMRAAFGVVRPSAFVEVELESGS